MNSAFMRALNIIFAFTLGLLSACSQLPGNSMERKETDTLRYIKILHTNDEHGWMEPYRSTSGAAGLAYTWKHTEGIEDGAPILILSSGDMWTGPALSTFFQGASMVETMNTMGYDAAAIGNHDFDFGIVNLVERQQQADFPLLSANIVDRATGDPPAFVEPFVLVEVNGVRVGVIGLTTVETPIDTKPTYVEDLRFSSYDSALQEYVPQIRQAEADLIIVLGHICSNEMERLAQTAAELGVGIIAGGHCHEQVNERQGEVILFQSTYFLRGYTRTELLVDIMKDEIAEVKSEFVANDSRRRDPEVERIVERWRASSEPQLWEPIGYLENEVGKTSHPMAELILRPWLEAWPSAQIALASPRYLQQDVQAGELTPATIWGVLSTENVLYEVEITGEELVQTVDSRRPLVLGLKQDDDHTLEDGTPVERNQRYRVLVPDTLYAGGDHYPFDEYDPEPVDTGIDWRQPVIEWIRSVGSNRSDPLDPYLSEP